MAWKSKLANRRAREIWLFFIRADLGPVIAAAFLGNFLVETAYTLSPYSRNYAGFRGIAQWQPGVNRQTGHRNRWKIFTDVYAKETHLYVYSIHAQLEFVAAELTGHLTREGDDYRSVLARLSPYRSITDPLLAHREINAATDIVTRYYEQAVNQPDQSLQLPIERRYEARFVLHDFWLLR